MSLPRDVIARVQCFAEHFGNRWYKLGLHEAWSPVAVAVNEVQLLRALGRAEGYSEAAALATGEMMCPSIDLETRAVWAGKHAVALASKRAAEDLYRALPLNEGDDGRVLDYTIARLANALDALAE